MKTLPLLLVVVFGLPLQAKAFHIPEHNLITARAISGLQKCNLLPEGWDMGWNETIVKANKAEDTDLIRKWSKYSHFYNPNKRLRMSRADSMVTIRESAHSVEEHDLDEEGSEKNVYKLVGRIVHHIQDAAVPAHVVPVNHFAEDGFEKTSILPFYKTPISISDCTRIAAMEPSELLRQTALTTLANLEQAVSFRRGKRDLISKWSQAFWVADAGNGFGQYGSLGDSFGKGEIELEDGRIVTVDRVQYGNFKKAQVELAISATQAAILWANQRLE